MTLALLDSSVLVSALHPPDSLHERGARLLRRAEEEFEPAVTAPVVAEVYTVARRTGGPGLARDLAGRVVASYPLLAIPKTAVERALASADGLSLVDAMLLRHAEMARGKVATLDERLARAAGDCALTP
ncbi:MAG: PIN domain-containing protein [Halobacteria archaeon]